MKARIVAVAKAALGTVTRWLAAHPAAAVTIPAAGIFMYHVRHDPIWVRSVLVLPVGLGFLFGVAGAARLIRARFHAQTLRIEAGVAAILLTVLFVFETGRWSLWTGPAFLLLFAWLVYLWKSSRRGAFFSLFSALLFLGGCTAAYRLLNAGERLLYYALYEYRSGRGSKVDWKEQSGRTYSYTRDDVKLSLSLPTDLFFHPAKTLREMVEIPNAGAPLCAVSSSLEDPSIAPLVVVFEGRADETVDEWKPGLEQMLGHMNNLARVENVRLEGDKEFLPDDSQEPWAGIFYVYTEVATMRRMRGGVYALPVRNGRRLFLLIREPIVPGFRHHPDVLRLFRGLIWSEKKESVPVK